LIDWRKNLLVVSLAKNQVHRLILEKNNVEYRMITGGCVTKHPYIKHFKYTIYKKLNIAEKAHQNGFFVGNSGTDLTKQIELLHKLLSNIK
jgi:CDP-6-deoxy-D-xylo-4-hexulose-3-dehydrase